MAAVTEEQKREAVRKQLREDFVYYPEHALKIVNTRREVVEFKLKRPQKRLALKLMEQRDRLEPMRAVVLKARKVGFSTQTQGLMIQRASQEPNHLAMVVAHDGMTAGAIFDIGKLMWAGLPAQIKPGLAYERNGERDKYLQFGESSLLLRRQGLMGLNSQIRIQTAGSAAVSSKGRGLTIHTLHMSEGAFWEAEGKRLALLNTVPDELDTLVIDESTAQGYNSFKDSWDAAVEGSSGYLPMFTPWFEEDGYRKPFRFEEEREAFEASLCTGRYGDDEEELLVLIPARVREWEREWAKTAWPMPRLREAELRTRVLEHLNWRRHTIASKAEGDIEKFHQEYPSTPEEAFLSTGRRVFKPAYVQRVLLAVDESDPALPSPERPGPQRGVLRGEKVQAVRVRRGTTVDVPREVVWVPRAKAGEETARWRMWSEPVLEVRGEHGVKTPAGQYIVAIDPESGEDNEGAEAESAIQVIDHRTLEQVAEWVGHGIEADAVAVEAFKAAVFFNKAWIAIEITGGWGVPHARKITQEFHYARVYQRHKQDTRTGTQDERLGWSTDARTLPLMQARGQELLREEIDGIRSRLVATQMLTYVKDDRGRSKPEPGKKSDALLAWLIAQAVAAERPLRPDRPRGAVSYTRNARIRAHA